MHERILGCSLPTPAALSYIGDAVHSLYVRRMLVARGITRSSELNEKALLFVTAEAQAELYRRIEGELLPDEQDVFRRAFNSNHLNKPRRASAKDYRIATGFEAVLGMLEWIGDRDRLLMLLELAHRESGDGIDIEGDGIKANEE